MSVFSIKQSSRSAFVGLMFGLMCSGATGWTVLVLGGRTDGAARLALALASAVFVLVAIGWGRGRRGWLQGLAGAAVLGGGMLAHFWSRVGSVP